MNRRIKGQIFPYMREETSAWRVFSTIILFVFVFIVCAALSIDDIETDPPRTLNPWETGP